MKRGDCSKASWLLIVVITASAIGPGRAAAGASLGESMPPGNSGTITSATIEETEKILDLTFTPQERNQMLLLLTDSASGLSRTSYESMRQQQLLNSDPPALIFNPLPIGFTREPTQRPIAWSAPTHVTLPWSRADLAFYSVRDLGSLILSHQITSMELTRFCLDRLKQFDPSLLCVITLTEDLALQQAARADAELAQGKYRGPLHGIPYAIKDLFATRGYRTTWGAAPYKDQVIDEDATVVRRLEEAGAVLVAKLSLGSLAMNDVWFGGMTRNPWNLSEGSSGSSAGPAAATAAGLVPFAIGTETIGSIVSPCTRCRVTGLRSTFGRVSRTGAMTLSWSMDKIGPICRSVEDCAMVFEAIRGSDGQNLGAMDAPFNYDPTRDLKTLRVGYCGSYVDSTVRNRLAGILGTGQDPSRLMSITLPTYPYQAMSLVLEAEAAAAFDELTRSGADDLLTSQGTYDWPNVFRTARTIPAVEYLQASRLRQKLVQDMALAMKDIDVYVTTDSDLETLYITNLTGQPCVVIPNGGPTSLSFIGKPLDEATILVLAKAYQDATAFHTAHPPGFAPPLVAYWTLDETEGLAAHDSAGGKDATLQGNPVWQPAGGKVDGALQFDGVDDYVSTGFVLNPGAGASSVFAWVKGGAPGQVVLSQAGGVNWLSTDLGGGQLMTDLKMPGRLPGSLRSQTAITDGTWHHVGVCREGSTLLLYVDDVEVARDTQTKVASESTGLYIGAGKNLEPGSFWAGLIDDVRIYSGAVKP